MPLPEGIHWPRYATPPKVISPFLGVAYRPDGMPRLRVQIIANSIGMPPQRVMHDGKQAPGWHTVGTVCHPAKRNFVISRVAYRSNGMPPSRLSFGLLYVALLRLQGGIQARPYATLSRKPGAWRARNSSFLWFTLRCLALLYLTLLYFTLLYFILLCFTFSLFSLALLYFALLAFALFCFVSRSWALLDFALRYFALLCFTLLRFTLLYLPNFSLLYFASPDFALLYVP